MMATRLADEQAAQQIALAKATRDLTTWMARLVAMPDEPTVAATAPTRQRKERPVGTRLQHDPDTLEWLIDMAPERWTNQHLADAMGDLHPAKIKPSVSWVGKQRDLYRPRQRKRTCP
jgi:hypothetical protein